MASLIKLNQLSKICLKNPLVSYMAVRNHWNKNFKPGPYPRTSEEIAAAAKKYGLTLDEYEPYPDDGMGHGDYPNLPLVSTESKDPWYPYDFPELKRNFNEPVHVHCEMIGEDRYDVSARLRFPMWKQCLAFFGVMFGCATVYLWLERMRLYRPVLPKQLPAKGKTHYTFEHENMQICK